jgi:hypothetical protein
MGTDMKTPITERGGLVKRTHRYYLDDIEYVKNVFRHNYNAGLREIVAEWVNNHKRRVKRSKDA